MDELTNNNANYADLQDLEIPKHYHHSSLSEKGFCEVPLQILPDPKRQDIRM